MLAPLAASACSGTHAAGGRDATVIRITERDFRIHVPARIAAGNVRLVVTNHGPDQHELIVVRTAGGELPLRSDGATVDEETLDPVTVGVLEAGAVGSVRELDVHLRPGSYEVFCNMAGHYLGGMSAEFTVV
ncbi:MAG TPA: hypothetical protein VLB81_13755 [Gaiellales bacterium]|nr:hypothetical protein [Gaiellales bacterium]